MNTSFTWFIFQSDWVVKSEGGGSWGIYRENKKRLVRVYIEPSKEKPTKSHKRSQNAQQFINEVQTAIMKTGVVKNTHKEYNTRTNKRYRVSSHQARVIAWGIAKSNGLRAGRKPPHLHKK